MNPNAVRFIFRCSDYLLSYLIYLIVQIHKSQIVRVTYPPVSTIHLLTLHCPSAPGMRQSPSQSPPSSPTSLTCGAWAFCFTSSSPTATATRAPNG